MNNPFSSPISSALMNDSFPNLRLVNGGRWMVYDTRARKWVVRQPTEEGSCVRVLIETPHEPEALFALLHGAP